MERAFRSIRHFMTVAADNPQLLQAQYRAFSRQMPLMYFILMSSTWAVAATHMATAPTWLTVGIPVLLTVVSGVRVLHWWKSRHADPAPERALQALRQINYLAFGIATAFTAWSFLLFPYGDAYTRSHLAFYMAITVISCIFSLMHLRSAAVIVAVIVNGAFITFFAATGQPTFIATAVNIACVSFGMLVVLNINYRTFARMVNARIEAQQKAEAQSRLLRMIDNMPVAVMTIDPDTLRITYANETSKNLIRSVEHLVPIKADELIGSSMDVLHRNPEHQRRILSDPANLPFHGRMNLGPEVLEVKVSPITADDGTYLGPMLTWAIVTQEVESERRIHQLAHYDALTALPNRVTFREALVRDLAVPGNSGAVLYIDLDGFKLINDTRGHPLGDTLLIQVANRLRETCDSPAMTVGRLGGDEFAVFASSNDPEAAAILASKIIGVLSAPYDVEYEKSIQLGASIGIALAPEHGWDADTLLARADMALYEAKAAGKGTYKVFSDDLESKIQSRMHLQASLRATLETREGLFVFYQPIIDARTKEITAREALVRWHHPQRGWISPSEFVPIAEQCGLIDQLGEFVLDTACRDAAEWDDGARVAVNVSAAQLGKGTIAAAMLSALARSGLSPDRLEIEVTETAILDDEHGGIADLRRIRDMGVRVALDDFGTGYSSLTHLRAFPFDKIKIDGSFVKDAVERPESAAIVRAIALLGKRLGVTTVAEGVETEAHLNRALKNGCSEIQGYFYGRPEPSAKDAALVAELNKITADIAAA